jgi:DNA polymerase III subunit alpha
VTEFVHLHCHSEHSLLDGMSTPEEIAQMSSSNGQFAAAITDHGTMAGVLRFQDACQKNAVRPVFGVEAYFVPSVKNDGDGKHERFHLILLAKNNVGLNKLFKMSQIGWQDNFYYKPRIDFDLLEDMVDDDIIALSGCRGSSISKAIEAGEYGRAEQLSERFIKIFKDDFYFELQAWNPREINDGLLDLASSFGKKAVATADCHFPTHADKGVEEVLLLVSQYPSIGAQTINTAKENLATLHTCGPDLVDRVNHLYPDRYLRFDDINPYIADATTVLSWFKEAGYDRQDILENTIEVASKCSAEIVKRRNLLPKYMKSLDSDDYLSELTNFRLKELNLGDEYKTRLDEELGIIKQLGFSDYFLIVWDLISWADANGIGRGTGRGSVGGSVMAFLLNITKVDPIKYNLLFARFINPDRNDYPDIDLDFEDKRRNEAKSYLRERWGHDNVAAITTYGTFKPKSAIKDVARVLQVSYEETNNITPFFETIEELLESPKGKIFCNKYPDVPKVAKRLEGRIRNAGVHAAGMVVSSIPLNEVCPIETRKETDGGERVTVTAFDMTDAEAVGLIKIDILGLKTVSVIKDCLAKIKELKGVDVEAQSLALDDQAVFSNFNNGNTVGVFQTDAAAYRNLIERMGIDNFNDLVVSNALVRPGALLSQGQKYIDCKKGFTEPYYPDKSVKDILEETYGTVIFQEQLMQMSVKISGFTWSDADKLRKIIGKKRDVAEFKQYKDKFINNAIIPKAEAKQMWSEFEMSALYMFNKSHAVAYSMLSYQTMWLKVNYPLEFIWALLYNEDSSEKITAYLMEAQRLKINILPPDVNYSEEYFTTYNKDGVEGIRFGLSNVAGCGASAIKEITTKRPFSCLDEFNNKCSKSAVKAPLRQNLEKVGAYASLNHISQYEHERYYLPVLGFSIQSGEEKNEMDEFVGNLADFHEVNSPLTLVKAIVRSTKKTPQYLRIEFEDHSGSSTVFADRNTEMANRDYVYALIGDRTLHSFCDAYNFVGTDLHKFITLRQKGDNHEYNWLYDTGLGHVDEEKTLMYVMHSRVFTTSKDKTMANMYCWDGRQIFKVVIFPRPYTKLKGIIKQGQWYAARLSKIEEKQTLTRMDSYKVESDSAIISIENYIERKNLVKDIV